MKFHLIYLHLALLLTGVLTSCHVSEAWAMDDSPSYFPVNPPSPRDARPAMTYPVPVSQRAFLTAGRAVAPARPASMMQVPVANYRAAVQTTAVRAAQNAAPGWREPSRTPAATPSPRKVTLQNGRAVAPANAPAAVHRAVAAANHLQQFPYKWGGGHAKLDDDGYDCSGATSYILREAGLMAGQRTSRGFHNFGESGQGEWITVWARKGHVFLTIGGLRFDTGGSSNRTGPRWKSRVRKKSGLLARHPRGF